MTESELLLSHRDFVRALATELVRDPATRDDVEQETLLASWRHGEGGPRSPRGFLATVARNFARQFHRGDERRREREARSATPERMPSVVEVLEREERRRAVVAAVIALAEPYRAALLLRYYEGLSPRAIARQLAVPVETVRTRIKRGVELLRARLLETRADGSRGLVAWLLPLARPAAGLVPAAAKWGALATAAAIVGVLGWGVAQRAALANGARADGPRSPDGATVAALASEPTAVERRRDELADPMLAATIDELPLPASSSATIAGVVVDDRSLPVAGARVVAWPDRLEAPVRLDDGGLAGRPHATSDGEGHFEIVLPSPAAERWTLVGIAEGWSPAAALSLAPGTVDATLRLEGSDWLAGTVATVDGTPIGGAVVRTWGMHGGALIEHETTAASDGSYRVEAPIADRAAWQGDSESWLWWVEARAAGFAPRVVARQRNLDPDAKPGVTRLDLTLLRGMKVVGSVVDVESGAAVAETRVVVVAFEQRLSMKRRDGSSLPNPHGTRVVAEARSDEEGRFEIAALPARAGREAIDVAGLPDFVQLFVLAPGFATAFADVPREDDGEVVERTVELWQTATIAGRVVDGEGRPVAGVQVQVVPPRHWMRGGTRATPPACVGAGGSAVVRSDGEGNYEFDGVPARADAAGRLTIGVRDRDWQVRVDDGALLAGVAVDVRAAERVVAPDLVVVRERGVRLEVVDEAGRSVAGARVTALPEWNEVRETDADGRLHWSEQEMLVADERDLFRRTPDRRSFRVERDGYASVVTPSAVFSTVDPPLVRVVLARAHRLEGSVLDRAQQPAARASVHVLREVPTAEELEALRSTFKPLDPDRHLSSTVTDGHGRFRIADLPDGRWFVVVFPPIAHRDDRRDDIAIEDDVAVDGPPLTLRLAPVR